MPRRLWNNPSILRFIGILILIGMPLQALLLWQDNRRWLVLASWIPALAVLAIGKPGLLVFAHLRKFDGPWVLLASVLGLLPPLLVALSLGSHPSLWSEGMIWASWIVTGFLTAFAAGLGQEIGWRGFLQPHLSHQYGRGVATLLTAAIWAYWHLPATLFGAHEWGHRLLQTFVLFPITALALSVMLTWLREKSGAIWPCAFLHGYFFAGSKLVIQSSLDPTLVASLVTLSAVVMASIVAAYEAWRTPHENAPPTVPHLQNFPAERVS